jgi:hypothetical protein
MALGLALVSIIGLSGCGRNEFRVARTAGVIECNGKPVSGGVVFFSPVASSDKSLTGKPASGDVDADGSFVLTTYHDDDGAIVGRHKVTYSPPVSDDPQAPRCECAGAAPVEVEVEPGENDITVELSAK